eukprot:TRINITY_DN680_c1_g1_i1.p1 TRINITY_DN680_c1_g1~~TRINITY_DN680_c1_g1_i1.p1  ORF type:complete len:363 (+),score=96.20 TRINITY_DN680_c1_g1_i1:25-1113(+)
MHPNSFSFLLSPFHFPFSFSFSFLFFISRRHHCMDAVVLYEGCGPLSLKVEKIPIPEPAEGELRVKVYSVGLNPVDYKVGYRGPQKSAPHVLGLDVAGIVDAVGANTEGRFKVGDKVYFHGNLTNPHGGFAEYTTIEEMVVAPFPEGLSFSEAAALPCAGLTAYHALHRRIPMREGEWILIHGAAGGVGGFAVQLAHLAGMKIMATCSSSNFESVTKLGADICIDYHKEDVTARVMEITKGDGAYAILNTVSPESATEDLKRIMYNGHLAVVAGLPDLSQHERFKTAPSFHEISLGACHIWAFERGKRDLAVMAKEFGVLASKKQIDPMLTEVVDMRGIPEALARIEGRHVRGKIVAEICRE